MLSSLLAGLAGIMASCNFSGVHPNAGTDLEFQTIAGAVIGGTALTGGVGTVLGTIVGVSTLLALRSGLVLMSVNVYWYRIVLGPLLVAVVALKETLPRLYKK
jgi:simple sugar transport system permease protein